MYDHSADSRYAEIPARTLAGMDRWGQHGDYLGDFLYAVMGNSLYDTFARADAFNRAALPAIVLYVQNQLPLGCWGSAEIVAAWKEEKRRERERAALAEQSV